MTHGRKRINPSSLGSKGEESTKDLAMFLSQSGVINGSRGLQSRCMFGRRRHEFNFLYLSKGTDWISMKGPVGFWRCETTAQPKGQAWKWRCGVISVSKMMKTKRQEAEPTRETYL